MKKIGIITFHNSYNCGSMLETYAIYNRIKEIDKNTEIINFSSEGQLQLYSTFEKNNSLKNILKNIVIFPHVRRIDNNNKKYEEFKKQNFNLSKQYKIGSTIDDNYLVVVAGSDQIWNITIEDYDDAYFLNWVKTAKKVAYAPSFGSKNILKYSNNPGKYAKLINSFDALSIREKNGQKWIKDLIGRNAELLIDPTLLYDSEKYDELLDNTCTPNGKYIFFYCPGFNRKICKFIKKISKIYKLPVICWSTKSYYKKTIYTFGFKLPKYESPSVYLSLIKNASMVFTTSFHGTIFSYIYRKKFYVIKNGGMYGDDDRVITLLEQLNLNNRLIEPIYSNQYDYMQEIDFKDSISKLNKLRQKANEYIIKNIGEYYEKSK